MSLARNSSAKNSTKETCFNLFDNIPIAIDYFNRREYSTYQCYRTHRVRNHLWAPNVSA